MDEYLGKLKTRRDDLFLKLVKKISKAQYTMHFMEDRYGRRAMFYNYKGVEIKKDDCVLLKATIAEHRYDRYNTDLRLRGAWKYGASVGVSAAPYVYINDVKLTDIP